MIAIETIRTREQATSASRSWLYRLLANGFLYPDRSFFAALKTGQYRDEVAKAAEALDYDFESTLDGLVASGTHLDFQGEYLRLFEVGHGMPPCPLYSGLYRGGRKAVMEELTRFYNYFGLSVEQGRGELPDHLATELEFMHFLVFKELASLTQDEDPGSYQRAQADFLARQLVSWLPSLEARLRPLAPPPFYVALAWLTNLFARAELDCVRAIAQQTIGMEVSV